LTSRLKTYLQQLNFLLGRDPLLQKSKSWKDFVPDPFKAIIIISADFELAWASRYSKKYLDPLKSTIEKAQIERKNIPKILTLCEKFDIPITWLTVGHLFLESCSKINGVAHPDHLRPDHFENEWWNYSGMDWFEYDPGTDYKTDPLWYCPDLIRMILNSNVKHEIGCHTFSHIDCSEDVCRPELFMAEIEACQKAAEKLGIYKMESFVHPGHTIGNLGILAKHGFTNFRTDYANILGYPKRHENGLWEFGTTLELEFKNNWSLPSQINRYISTIKRGLRNHSVVYFWFHPSCNETLVDHIMPSIFKWVALNREKIWITNQREYIKWLNRIDNKC
jgi:peptidoglycan/xylan/chitin deacetylase (PgdA/CDA1 family)